MSLVATLLLSPTVKEFLKSANISQSYEQISSGTFFKVHSVSITVWYLVLVLEILFLVVDLAKDLLCKCNWIKEYMTLLSFGKDIIMLQQFAKVFLMRSLVQRVLPIVRFVKHLLNRSWEYVCGETEAESMCVAKQKLRVCVWRGSAEYGSVDWLLLTDKLAAMTKPNCITSVQSSCGLMWVVSYEHLFVSNCH